MDFSWKMKASVPRLALCNTKLQFLKCYSTCKLRTSIYDLEINSGAYILDLAVKNFGVRMSSGKSSTKT